MNKRKWFIIIPTLLMLAIACSSTATLEPPATTTQPTTAPIPDAALGPAVDPEKGYLLRRSRMVSTG